MGNRILKLYITYIYLALLPLLAVCLVAKLCLFCDFMNCSPPGCSVHEISRQEYWSGLPFPSPRDRPRSGIKAMSPALSGEGNGSPLQYSCLGNPTERSLVGYSSWDHKALDTTGWLNSSCIGRRVLYQWASREAPSNLISWRFRY